MKKKIILLSLVLCLVQIVSHAQQSIPFYLGKCDGLFGVNKLKSTSTQQGVVKKMNLAVSPLQTFVAKVNYIGTTENGKQEFAGELEGVPSSTFFVRFNGKSLEGNIILKSTKEAYKYFSDEQGNAYVSKTDINGIICIDYNMPKGSNLKAAVAPSKSALKVSSAVLNLQSYPGANGCVLLDFDGQYVVNPHWNSGNPIDAQAFSNLTDDNVQEAWELISEDYRPFNVNITTSEAIYNTYPKNRRVRCIFTPTNTAAPGAGGVAYVGCFNWGDETPCWSFMAGGKAGGEAASHEVGHTLGLGHDGRTSPVEEYYAGQGNWAPIMGVGYYKPITQWSKGEYANANNQQDDIAIISSATYGLGYRADDHGNTFATAAPLNYDAAGNVSADQNFGVIETNTDVDMFSFSTSGGNVVLNFNTVTRHADLDILVTLYNSAGAVIATYDPTGLNSNINTNLVQGSYYVAVQGTGAGNPATDGYSNYASLGTYYISGTIPPAVNSSNLALNKPAVASSLENSSFPANLALDGNTATRWSSAYSDPQWIYVDLGVICSINRVKLTWEAAYASSYEIQVSNDANTWTSVYSTTTGTGGVNDLTVAGSGRYVRVYGTKRATPYGYSLWEFEVYGAPTNLALNKPATASSLEDASHSANLAFDGNLATRWSSAYADPQWIYVDLGATYNISRVKLTWEAAFANNYSILVSDGSVWTSIYNTTTGTGGVNDLTLSGTGRYVSVYCTTRGTAWGNSLWEVEVYGSASIAANILPSISLISPASGTVYNGPSDITITANASDTDGTIAKVEFFNGSAKLGEATSAPYTYTWTGVAVGSYTITATATDNMGGKSSVQTSVVVNPLVGATVYQDCNYSGYAVDLAPGSYTLTQLMALGIKNDDISSLKVKTGYEAILYQDDNFGGSAYLFRGDFSCLVSLYANNVAINLSDWTSSIVVETSTAAASLNTSNVALQAKSELAQIGTTDKTLVIAPNPFVDYVTVRLENTNEEYFNVKILNTNGKEVMSQQKFKNGTELHLNDLDSGLYFILIQTETGMVTKKIIKL